MRTRRSVPGEVSTPHHENRTFVKCRDLSLGDKALLMGGDCNDHNSSSFQSLSSKDITPQFSFNHLAIPQAWCVIDSLFDSNKNLYVEKFQGTNKWYKSSVMPSKAAIVKNKGLIAEAYEWDEEEVSSDDNDMVEVKVLMALDEENYAINKEGAKHGEWVKISMRKLHTLLEVKDNDDRKTYLDYLCIDLNYVKEQRNNLLSKHKDLVHEQKTCKEQLLLLKQAKLDFPTMQHKRILGVDQLTEDPSSSGQKDVVFVKSLAGDTKVSIPSVERPWLFEAEGFIRPNPNTGRILPAESQRNTTDPPVAVTDSSVINYDSTDESLVCSTPLPPLKKLDGVESVSGPKTIKSILRSKSTFKAETLKGVIINEPSLTPAKGNKSSSASKFNSAPAGKLKSVKIEVDPPLAIVIKELNDLKLQISKNQSSYSRSNQTQQCERTDHKTCDHAECISTMNMSQHLKKREINPINPQHAFKRCEACRSSTHTTTDHYDIEWFKRGEALQAKKAEALKSNRVESLNANRSKTLTKITNSEVFNSQQANPKESHLIAVKRIFKYLKGTPSHDLWYPKCSCFDLKGYSDSDYAGCNMDRKSTSGASQFLGGKLMCLSAKKQQYVAMSLVKVEYVVSINYDNTSAIAISNNLVLHSRTKYIDIRYHILKGDIELHFIPTQYPLTDIFTKPLDEPTFKRLIVKLGMLNIDSKPKPSVPTEEN
ncbi:hypothetical protein Tco_0006079 [Tanacetum coccineum]